MKKNGTQIAQEKVELFRSYLSNLRTKNQSLPRQGDGPNKTQIAEDAKLGDRQVFRTNPKCKEMLDQAVIEIGLEGMDSELRVSISNDEKDRMIRDLKQRLVNAEEKINHAEEKIKQLSEYKALYEMALESGGRRV